MLVDTIKKFKKTAIGLGVTAAAAIGIAIEPDIALAIAEGLDLLEQIFRGLASAGAEVAVEAVTEANASLPVE